MFNTRSPDRPNPIGLHPVEVVSIDGTSMRVRNLEALDGTLRVWSPAAATVDGTPVLDVKPVI